MSRIANNPVVVPGSVDVKLDGQNLSVKGGNGQMNYIIHDSVEAKLDDGQISFESTAGKTGVAMAGTMRALVQNMITGVDKGFEKRLNLFGVGYRAKTSGKNLELTLGFSHPVLHAIPDGITIETPSQTEVVIKGYDKQLVGQVAANIRAYRPPEPYKGKGVRYADERIIRKEAKKK